MREPLGVHLDAPHTSFGRPIKGRIEVDSSAGFERIEVELAWTVRGTAPTLSGVSDAVSLRLDDPLRADLSFSLLPSEGPRSYDGGLFSAEWTVRVRGVRPGLDKNVEVPVQVSPLVDADLTLDPVDVAAEDALVALERSDDQVAARPSWTPKEKLIGFVAGGAALAAVVWMLRDMLEILRAPGVYGRVLVVLVGAAALLPLWLIWIVVRRESAEEVLGPVEVKVSEANATPGGAVGVVVRFGPRKTVRLEDVAFRLRAIEHATYLRRTRPEEPGEHARRKERVVVRTRVLDGAVLEPGGTRTIRVELPLPAQAPPSYLFDEDRKIVWAVDLAIRLRGALDWVWDGPVVVRST